MKRFLIIGNLNAISYKEVFPLIKDNKVWLGTQYVKEFVSDSGETKKFGNTIWYTNLDHNKRHSPIVLTQSYSPDKYPKYDNYSAINVDKVCDIPLDYNGAMGVPITFLDKYCPEQFEIVGGFNRYKESDEESGLLCGTLTEYVDKNGKVKTWTGPTINRQTKYYRLLIKSK